MSTRITDERQAAGAALYDLVEEYGWMCDDVGRSRGVNNYPANTAALDRVVNLALEIERAIGALAAPTPQPEAPAVPCTGELRRALCAIGIVGEYMGKDTILRDSVLDILDMRSSAAFEARLGGGV